MPLGLERRRRLGPWGVRALVVVAGMVGLTVFAAIESTHPRWLPALLLVSAIVAAFALVSDSSGAAPADWSPPIEQAGVSSGQDPGLAANVRLVENHLSARQVDANLSTRIARMTNDRLTRLGHSRGDPEVERQLGPTLIAVLDGPPRPLRAPDIEECIRRIEELTP